ncbi:hypothetical protein L1987_41360 [Smallanthus sonchifolius]|uniref:Uncharacterized protein n=1 Tax=Smallanthus sonchifolius TaxID=185202 RepID=A0ACB9GVL2_9ASTR|nr:hypothetical protein L1987_41360 [Smallanthus sonchifolius]
MSSTGVDQLAVKHAVEVKISKVDINMSYVKMAFYVLDLTIVGLDSIDGDSNMPSQQPHYLKTCSKLSLNLGSIVYLLGYTEKNELTVGEGKVVIATYNLIKVCAAGVTWGPGSAGFDAHGNLSFLVCDPMKLATSPTTKSTSMSSSPSSSQKKDLPMQFGIPIPVICDWLNQHWEGSLDDLVNKPKLPLIRLMSTGQKSEQLCTSFTMRQEKPKHPNINFPPKIARPIATVPTLPVKEQPNHVPEAETSLMGSLTGPENEIRSCSSPGQVSEGQNGYISEGDTTLYSAETAESRNYPSPKEGRLGQQQVGRSQSCVNYERWGPVQASPMVRGRSVEKRRSYTQGRKVFSQGATSHRSNVSRSDSQTFVRHLVSC